MLKSKVKERQLIEENRKKVCCRKSECIFICFLSFKAMASVTAPDDIVPSWSELVEQCANDQSCHMLLLMAQSSITSDDSVKEKLVKVNVNMSIHCYCCIISCRKQRLVCWLIRSKDVHNNQLFKNHHPLTPYHLPLS